MKLSKTIKRGGRTIALELDYDKEEGTREVPPSASVSGTLTINVNDFDSIDNYYIDEMIEEATSEPGS